MREKEQKMKIIYKWIGSRGFAAKQMTIST